MYRTTKNNKTTPRPYAFLFSPVATKVAEKDISGGIFSSFDPTKLMTPKFFSNAKTNTQRGSYAGFVAYTVTGAAVGGPIGAAVGAGAYGAKALFLPSSSVPDSLILTIIVVSGLIMGFAAYAFFIAGISFLARLIELWVLIIASPFAFMSMAIPALSGVEYVGWDSWIKKLMKTSFMAPIFMFFVYIIFLIVQKPLFGSLAIPGNEQDTYQVILLIIIQALIVLVLLMQATSFAKKGSGQLGEALISGAKVIGGLALGGAALGTAAFGRGTVGAFMKGATTGDTLANRVEAERRTGVVDPGLGRIKRAIGGRLLATPLPAWQNRAGTWLNARQVHHEEAREARHDLDTAAGAVVPGKKWDELNGAQRLLARTKLARDRAVRENAGNVAGPLGLALGTRKWDALTTAERTTINNAIGSDGHGGALPGSLLATHTTVDDLGIVNQARRKQGVVDTVTQSATTGSYDVRNLANVVARAQTSGFTMLTAGLVGAVAMSMRGGFKSMGINHGEGKGNFFQDLGNTVTDALKSAKIDIDLSHVGEVKKKDDKSGGGHH